MNDLEEEMALWAKAGMDFVKMAPNMNLVASGVEAIRLILIEKGIATDHELNMLQKRCMIDTLKNVRQAHMANKIVVPRFDIPKTKH